MPKPKSTRSVPLDVFLQGELSSYCKKCKTQWSDVSSDDFSKHVNKCRGVPNAVPIPNAGKGRPLIIEMDKKDKEKERAKEKKLKNSIAKAEKKRAARAAADAAAEAKGKTNVKGKEGKKGKNNKGY